MRSESSAASVDELVARIEDGIWIVGDHDDECALAQMALEELAQRAKEVESRV